MNVLIVGCGYLGQRIVQWAPAGWKWHALTRTADRTARLRAAGIRPLVGNWLHRSDLMACDWPDLDAVVVSVPHRADPEHDTATHVVGLDHVLASLPSIPPRIVYISTTGVYPDAEGQIDEETPADPQRPGGRIALAAERWLWQRFPASSLIVRSAGIYGPGRLPMLDRLRQNLPLPVHPEATINLIHVDDLARIAVELLDRRPPRHLYVASDGNPVARGEFYRYLAQRHALPDPRFAPPEGVGRRGMARKRLTSKRLVADLDFRFLFPNYRAGVDAILDADTGSRQSDGSGDMRE